MRIKSLPDHVINQIAAGEIIERPASVVKELLENSFDAGANRIWIDIEKGGVRLIRVRDNGCGIHEEDISLAVTRHATSKLQKIDDLHCIMSLGFRGEALASIGACSRMALTSRLAGHESAWEVKLEGSEIVSKPIEVAHADGTTIEIRDLFFNVPARRKFLRTEKTESALIEEVIKRIALSRFDVGISYRNNRRMVFELKPAHEPQAKEIRLAKLYGNSFINHAVALEMESANLLLTGWVGLPNFSRNQTDLQAFYVNLRAVRDKMLNHAVREAYADLLPEGRYPAYALYLKVDPEAVDINVHPSKNEVRFRDSRLIHDFIVRSVTEALQQAPKPVVEQITMPLDKPYHAPTKPYVYQPVQSNVIREEVAAYYAKQKSYESDVALLDEADSDEHIALLGRVLGQVHGEYMLTETQKGLMIFNMRNAYQVVTKHLLQKSFAKYAIHSQPLLMPVTVNFDENIIDFFESAGDLLTRCGFDLECLGERTVVLRKLPIYLKYADLPVLLKAIATLIAEDNFNSEKTKSQQSLLAVLAEYALPKEFKEFSMTELTNLLREFESFSHEAEGVIPDGIYKEFSIKELHKLVSK